MKIAVLTSQTLHHNYFIRELSRAYTVAGVIVESQAAAAPFETHHPFEDRRESYERRVFFQGKDVPLADVAPTVEVDSVNATESVKRLREIGPDVIIVFGTGRVGPEVIGTCPAGIINLHGGDPEEYRGLDTHLWAIYHRDFGGLVTTLHRLNETIDDGPVILQAALHLSKGMELHELRRYNTEACVRMSVSALDMFQRWGRFISRPQRRRGRYYSLMPAELKEICRVRFREYTDGLS
ncbi:MAG TPA: formyl transferase [Dehalococcoidales bacterium]|nr:formyl transferase [Dehalococcoidales bacterium]